MQDLTPFERRLSDRLDSEAARVVAPFDPPATARAAVGRRSLGDALAARLAIGAAFDPRSSQRLLVVAIIALLLLAAVVAVGVGWALQTRVPAEPRLVLVDPAGNLVLANSDGSERSIVARPATVQGTTGSYGPVSWAPGGQHLAARYEPGFGDDLVVFDRGGAVVWATTLSTHGEIAWSPDGRHLAILDGALSPNGVLVRAHVRVIGLDGQASWTIPLPVDFAVAAGLRNLAWAPGPAIAVTGAVATSDIFGSPIGSLDAVDSFVWLADPAAGDVRQATSEDGWFAYAPAWKNDGRLLFASRGAVEHGLWGLEPSGGAATELASWADPLSQILPARQGKDVVVLTDWFDRWERDGRIARLALVDPSSGAVTDLVQPGEAISGSIAWSGSGRQVLYLLRTSMPPELQSVDTVDGTITVIASGALAFDVSQPAP